MDDNQRAAYDRLAAAIDDTARTALDGVCLADGELVGDFIVVAHVMSADLLDAGEGRYLTLHANGHLPAHSAAGLLAIGTEMAESNWVIGDEGDDS